MLAQIQNPVSVFRFNKVLTADQVMGSQEFIVDHLIKTLKGQNWVIHWNPVAGMTECQILFPIIPDRDIHIRPLADYLQQRFREDPAVLYRSRNEFLDLVRASDMARASETGGWGVTTMSRLNNLYGKPLTEVRTKIVSPTEVVHKYITREAVGIPVSPLATGSIGVHRELGFDFDARMRSGGIALDMSDQALEQCLSMMGFSGLDNMTPNHINQNQFGLDVSDQMLEESMGLMGGISGMDYIRRSPLSIDSTQFRIARNNLRDMCQDGVLVLDGLNLPQERLFELQDRMARGTLLEDDRVIIHKHPRLHRIVLDNLRHALGLSMTVNALDTQDGMLAGDDVLLSQQRLVELQDRMLNGTLLEADRDMIHKHPLLRRIMLDHLRRTMHSLSRSHFSRGIKNMFRNGMLTDYSPIGLYAPLGTALAGTPLAGWQTSNLSSSGLGWQGTALGQAELYQQRRGLRPAELYRQAVAGGVGLIAEAGVGVQERACTQTVKERFGMGINERVTTHGIQQECRATGVQEHVAIQDHTVQVHQPAGTIIQGVTQRVQQAVYPSVLGPQLEEHKTTTIKTSQSGSPTGIIMGPGIPTTPLVVKI